MIVGNMRSLYSGQNASARTDYVAFPGAVFVQQGVFPAEMLVSAAQAHIPAAGTIANNPWDQSQPGGSAQVSVMAAAVAGTPWQFIVRYYKIPADVCADLLGQKFASPVPIRD